MDEKAIRVLAFGGKQAEQIAAMLLPDAIVDYCDLKPNKQQAQVRYDKVISYHALQRISYREAANGLRRMVDVLIPGGELYLFIPSLEWAAEQILDKEPSPLLRMHLFGTQSGKDQFNLNGFTMLELRAMCAQVGISVRNAAAGEYTVAHGGEEYYAEQHLIVGVSNVSE